MEHSDPAFLSSSTTIAELNDPQNRVAVRTKTASELALALLVYRLCTLTWLVKLAPHIITFASRLHLSGPVYYIIKRTFFRQFCGGETADACVATMRRLRASGIGSILDLSIEADFDLSDTNANPAAVRVKSNAEADRVLELNMICLSTARCVPGSFAAIKITALAPPALLRDLTTLLQILLDAFHAADADGDGNIGLAEFREIVRSLPGAPTVADPDALAFALFASATSTELSGTETIDFITFADALSVENPAARPLLVSAAGFTTEHLEDYEYTVERLYRLCQYATDAGARIMIDAEQSYFQRAIEHLAMRLEREYNRKGSADGPVVFNTYQMYLKEALFKLEMDVERARRGGFVFAGKLVRGAYLISERKRATDLHLPDPIQPDLAATHASYDAGVSLLLRHVVQTEGEPSPSVMFMVASHNKESIIAACTEMERRGIRPEEGHVLFGQLLGMCDQLSYTLGQNGYPVYKYVPYGQVHEVIPYLIRRVQENSGVLGSVTVERAQLRDELMGRLLGRRRME